MYVVLLGCPARVGTHRAYMGCVLYSASRYVCMYDVHVSCESEVVVTGIHITNSQNFHSAYGSIEIVMSKFAVLAYVCLCTLYVGVNEIHKWHLYLCVFLPLRAAGSAVEEVPDVELALVAFGYDANQHTTSKHWLQQSWVLQLECVCPFLRKQLEGRRGR